jgi:hypothetical protein
MKKVISLIACFSIAVFAQDEQKQYPWSAQQPQQEQYPPQQQPLRWQAQYPPQVQQQPQYPPDQWIKIQKLIVQELIKDGVEKNKKEIRMESAYLSATDREYLYEKNKKEK